MNTLQPVGFYETLANIRSDARALFQVNMEQLSREEKQRVEVSLKSLSTYFDAKPIDEASLAP